jgi:hypothetical protein
MLNRRHFLQTTAVTAAAYAQGGAKRIAIVAGAYRADSTAGNLGDRFLVGYPYAGVWRKPAVKVASLYVEQKGAGDLSGDRAREFGLQAASSVAEAVKGADGVLLFEPRLFDECVKAFEQAGRAAPVYLYKDLGPSFEKAKAMVDASRRLRFPLMAAAAGPFTWRTPAIDLPMNAEVEAALVATAGAESDAIENLQSMVERRRGGESGVKSVERVAGDAVWKALDGGWISKELLGAALSRSDTPLGLTDKDGRTQDLLKAGEVRNLAKSPTAYLIEYRDGLKAAVLRLEGAIRDCNFAAKGKGSGQAWSTQFLMTPAPMFTHTACLAHGIEQMFANGVSPVPVERALLVAAVLDGKGGDQVAYKAPKESQFART